MILYREKGIAIIVVAFLHFISFFVIQVTVFVMIIRTGSGLHLVPHKLIDNSIQYEGYDNNKRHLFTFTVADKDTKKVTEETP